MNLKYCSIFLLVGCLCQSTPANEFFDVRGRTAQTTDSGYILEGETDFDYKSPARMQNMKGFGPDWSDDAHLLWDGRPGQSMIGQFYVSEHGEFDLSIQLTKAPDYGIFNIILNDRVIVKNFDLYAPRVIVSEPIKIPNVKLTEGSNKLEFQLTGGNPRARKFRGTSYLLGLDHIKLVPLNKKIPDHAVNEAREDIPSWNPYTSDEAQLSMKKFCLDCHNNSKKKGKVNLEPLILSEDFSKQLSLTGKILDALTRHEMPPEDEEQPSSVERQRLSQYFQSIVDKELEKSPRLVARTMRRMNRYEYNNAIRDLFRLKGDIYPLPEKPIRANKTYFNPESGHYPNRIHVGNRPLGKFQIEQQILDSVFPFAIDLQAEHGFNNQGNLLSFSPILLESFINLATAVIQSPQFKSYNNDYDTLFLLKASEESQANQIARQRLSSFLERAFRRPVTQQDINKYHSYFLSNLMNGSSFEASMKKTLTAVISSPHFLFLSEHDPESDSGISELDTYELASRLSFFLWASIPDDELQGLARDGKLADPSVYRSQISRLLEHPKSQSLSQNFARQWMRLDKLIASAPDFERFPIYYSRIGCEQWKFGLQMMMEPLLLFESIHVEDRSIMLLIDSPYTYRSDELQSWYKDSVPFGNKQNVNRFNTFTQTFKRRHLQDKAEGGIISTAAILTMTSDPLRTNPIIRGSWMAGVIFNNPPSPPPDVVPELESDDEKIEAEGLTLRQKLIAHQTNESCRTCHAKIDPLGFALENYDPVGRWREKYRSGLPIDTTGEYGELSFDGIEELKQEIINNPSLFIQSFSEHLLSYALGRELTVYDKPAVDKIVRNAMLEKGKLSSIIEQVATSYPFMHKSNQQLKF